MAEIISSRANRWVRRLRDAIDEHRDEIVLEGPKQVRDAIERGWEPIAIALEEETPGVDEQLVTVRVSRPLFRALTDAVHPQGVLGLFRRPKSSAESLFRNPATIVVALDGVQDPGNVGTIVRLAAAFDAGGVALTGECADPYSPKAIRASAGTILELPVHKFTRAALVDAAQVHQFGLFAAAASHTPTPEIPATAAVIVFGSEGSGVSREIADRSRPLSIGMSPRVESLNVAAAAAILLSRSYEARKDQG